MDTESGIGERFDAATETWRRNDSITAEILSQGLGEEITKEQFDGAWSSHKRLWGDSVFGEPGAPPPGPHFVQILLARLGLEDATRDARVEGIRG